MSGLGDVQVNLKKVQDKIEAAEKKAGRAKGSVILLAASKTKSVEVLLRALQGGVTHFAENYVQEASKKIEKIQNLNIDRQMHWHLIGALQTNKSKSVVGRFETIQSVDRIELAKALNSRAQEAGVVQNILIQVKLGDEPSKGGVPVSDGEKLIGEICKLENLRVEGLMSLPPIEAEAEPSRKYFSQLFELRHQWASLINPSQGRFSHLSMGTTHDYEVAIEEGATMVRIGTAIFGAREISGVP
jgi:pyridoxal phosphate enzyme (YggS family)